MKKENTFQYRGCVIHTDNQEETEIAWKTIDYLVLEGFDVVQLYVHRGGWIGRLAGEDLYHAFYDDFEEGDLTFEEAVSFINDSIRG